MNKKNLIKQIDEYENEVFNNANFFNDVEFNKLINKLTNLQCDLNTNKINLKDGIKEFEKIKGDKNGIYKNKR